jgi:hypothetical protein
LAAQIGRLHAGLVLFRIAIIRSSVCYLRFIVWFFLKARLQFNWSKPQGGK